MIVPEKTLLRASQWCYRGIWSVIAKWLRVPESPPELQGADDQHVKRFRPAEGFLSYLKFFFWIGLTLIDCLLLAAWVAITAASPLLGIALAPLFLIIMIAPDIVAYIAIHLQYDTTWYVLTDRSMRIRRGIWIIRETTITYDNIQNVSLRQGPLQRYFGIADVLVETAGGGSGSGQGENGSSANHSGLLQGISNAEEVRNLIFAKWNASRSAGLGDDEPHNATTAFPPGQHRPSKYSAKHLKLLDEIQQLASTLR